MMRYGVQCGAINVTYNHIPEIGRITSNPVLITNKHNILNLF